MSLRLFATGATGFIGQALVATLIQRGHRVTALVREPGAPAARELAAHGCALAQGDVTRAEGLADAMRGCDGLVHNAGVYELGASRAEGDRMQAVNVVGTDKVLAAAQASGVPRNVYVSTVLALGGSGDAASPADETHRHDRHYLSRYERSKAEAHEVALGWRAKGLPLVIGMPNAVMGANDHAAWGYFLRLYLMGLMPPVAFGREMVMAPVDVQALAVGLALAVERAPMGEDYLFCGPAQTVGEVFGHFARHAGGMRPRLWMPRGVMRPLFASTAPLLRALGLPAFFSAEVVDVTRINLNYSADKAQRELGWQHPTAASMWDRIVADERRRMATRRGWRARLLHESVSTPADPLRQGGPVLP